MRKQEEKKLEKLYNKAVKLKKEILKITDEIYEIDETFGECLLDHLQDEKRLRS